VRRVDKKVQSSSTCSKEVSQLFRRGREREEGVNERQSCNLSN